MKDAAQHDESEHAIEGASACEPVAERVSAPQVHGSLMQMQRLAGNQSTLRFVRSVQLAEVEGGRLQPKCACEEEEHPCTECAAKKTLQRSAEGSALAGPVASHSGAAESGGAKAPSMVHDVLRGEGR